jgi:hypothetical protein
MRARILFLASLAGLGLLGCNHAAPEAGPSTAASAAAPAGASLDERTPGYVAGQSYDYRLKLTSKLQFESRGDLYDFDLLATLELSPLRVTPEATELRATLRNSRIQSRVPNSQAEFDRIVPQLARPFLVTLKGGRVSDASLPRDVHPLVAGTFRSIGAALQLARSSTNASTWTATEFDTTGQYTADYRTVAGDPMRIEKRKLAYSSVLLAKGQTKPAVDVIPKIVSSRGEIRVAADGRPLSIDLEDELALSGAQTPIRSRTLVSLIAEANPERASAEPTLDVLRAQSQRFEADEPFESRVPESVLDEAKINGLSFAKITARLEEIAAEQSKKKPVKAADGTVVPEHTEEDSRLFLALGATFRQKPDTVASTLRKIRGNSPAKFAFVDALGAAESPGARDALIALAQPGTPDPKLRTSALVALSRTERPTAEGAAALKALIDDPTVGTQALYGIGSYCRRFRDQGDASQSEALGQILLARLAAAKNEYRTVEGLRAISNSGFAGAFDKTRQLLGDRRERVRAAAVRALRSMQVPEVDQLLVARLADDSSQAVLLATLETMQARPPTDTLLKALKNGSSIADRHVRYRIVELMSRWLKEHPDLRPSLEAVAKNEQEEKIRDLAKAALL